MSKSQILFGLLLSFITGVGAASFVSIPVFILWLILAAGAAVIFFGALGMPRRQGVAAAGCIIAAFAFGAFWFARAGHFQPSPFEDFIGKQIGFGAIVDSEPSRNMRTQQFVLREIHSGVKIFAVTRLFPEYAYGDRLMVSGRVERPENFSEDFDYVSYLAKDDIFYRVSFPDMKITARGEGSRLYRVLFALKSSSIFP